MMRIGRPGDTVKITIFQFLLLIPSSLMKEIVLETACGRIFRSGMDPKGSKLVSGLRLLRDS